MANLLVDQGHDSQLTTIAAKDVHPWESPECKIFVALTLLQTIHLAFFSSCLAAFDMCKNTLIYSNAKEND